MLVPTDAQRMFTILTDRELRGIPPERSSAFRCIGSRRELRFDQNDRGVYTEIREELQNLEVRVSQMLLYAARTAEEVHLHSVT